MKMSLSRKHTFYRFRNHIRREAPIRRLVAKVQVLRIDPPVLVGDQRFVARDAALGIGEGGTDLAILVLDDSAALHQHEGAGERHRDDAGNGIAVGLTGVGSYTPERVLTNADLEELVDTSDEWIVTRTGIRERRIAAPEQAASDLALPAARAALEQAGVEPGELDLVVLATATPDMLFPATAALVADAVGARKAAACR